MLSQPGTRVLRGDAPTVPSDRDRWAYAVYALILVSFAGTAYYQLHDVAGRVLAVASAHHDVRLFLYPSLAWTAMGMIMLAFRSCVWVLYRPFAPAAPETAPSVTVVIPAYNEGAMVLKAIAAVAAADFPRDRIEILVVDDGSTDDTWDHIAAAARQWPALVTALRHERNRGKREALALAFARARGEIIVTVDSDSVIERDALLAIVGPFRDPRVGAVAGKVLVYNRARGLIPRMMHVRFVLSFDLLRSAESAFGNVFCCPGALSALRTDAVRRVVDRWRSQRFLGAPCTIGEDRALTNFLFEAGYDAVYQRSAVVHTEVPEQFSKLCKMLLRWDRSYVREEIRFARIVWKRPLLTRCVAIADRVVTNVRYPVNYGALSLLPFLAAHEPAVLARLLVAMGFVSLLNMLYFLRSERSFDFLYGVLYAYFSALTLFWIFPYAALTVRARSWLTR
jgi:hyaluronan synthase